MNLSIVRQVIIGFTLLTLLMVAIAIVGLKGQRELAASLALTSDKLAPILRQSAVFTSSAQNAVRSVATHATLNRTALLNEQEQNFDRAADDYRSSINKIMPLLAIFPRSKATLEQIDLLFIDVLKLAGEHLTTHRQQVTARQQQQEELNRFKNSWQYFEPYINDIEFGLSDNERKAAWVLKALNQDAIDVAGYLTQINTIQLKDMPSFLANLTYHQQNFIIKLNIIAAKYPSLAAKFERYKTLLQFHVNDNQGIAGLHNKILKLNEQGLTLREQFNRKLATAMLQLESLNTEIAKQAEQLNIQAKEDSQDSLYSIMIALAVALAAALKISWLIIARIRSQTKRFIEEIRVVAAGDFTSDGFTKLKHQGGEFGVIAEALDGLVDHLSLMIKKVTEYSNQLAEMSTKNQATLNSTRSRINEQTMQTENLATAITEMDSSINEVSNNAANTANVVDQVYTEAQSNSVSIRENIDDINRLRDSLDDAGVHMQTLLQNAGAIDAVVTVIKSIAEQTNLLALNAAIEAARAGDHGRGFAVVSDEVRALASKTQESTVEITAMVESLQKGSNQAHRVMKENQEKATLCAQKSNKTSASLDAMLTGLDKINDMSMVIATAVEEQSSVAQELSRNVNGIAELAEHVLSDSAELSKASELTSHLAVEQRKLTAKFTVK
ncbi:methyl-accepting chemotaxis protein [Algibacillus agarilyticus]|uniref:methyl-accepting chemotaxis protein n=1 Tax=Algibacillus agarilyticus TaxID=2234133 RepID=UPI000DD03B66|nr:methyl-accepting chemotaxis protein [Algibacillus agarilyticus]